MEHEISVMGSCTITNAAGPKAAMPASTTTASAALLYQMLRRSRVHSILEAPPPASRAVLVNRQRVDVAEPPMVQIPGGGVMNRVGLLPVVIRREREHAQDGAHHVGQALRREEGPVPAVVLEDEQPDEEKGFRYRQRQRKRVAHAQTPVHQRPSGEEQAERAQQLPEALAETRPAVWGKRRRPLGGRLLRPGQRPARHGQRWRLVPPARGPALIGAATPAVGGRLEPLGRAGLEVVSPPPELLQNARTLYFASERFQGPINPIVFAEDNLGHVPPP